MVGNADSLRSDCILYKPQMVFWGELEGWEVVQPCAFSEFNTDPDKWAEDEKNTGYSSHKDMTLLNTPMMNYLYPLPSNTLFSMEDAKKIMRLSLCLVWMYEVSGFEDGFALALTGGGQDLSWAINSAYIALGYYPPIHFRLPGGRFKTDANTKIAEICMESNRIAKNWMDNNIRDLENTVKHLSLLEAKCED